MLIATGIVLLVLGGWPMVRAPTGAGRHRGLTADPIPSWLPLPGAVPGSGMCKHGAVLPVRRPHRLEA